MSSRSKNNHLVRFYRLTRLALHLMVGCAKVGLLFPFLDQRHRDNALVGWARQLLTILRVRVEVRGHRSNTQRSGCVIAANHVSWLDVYVLQSLYPVRFVAKSEIRDWPVIGWLCDRAGTLFIERDKRHHTAMINEVMRDVVREGGTVGLFPEATTTLGDRLKKFHSSLFQAVVASGAPLVPVAIRYTDSTGVRSEVAAYVDDTSLGASLLSIVAAPELRVVVHFAAPIRAEGKTRRDLALEAQEMVASLLFSTTNCNPPEIAPGLPA